MPGAPDWLMLQITEKILEVNEAATVRAFAAPPVAPGMEGHVTLETRQACPDCHGVGVRVDYADDMQSADVRECECARWVRIDRPKVAPG